MRRLPIFFLIDVSESMIGEPINEVNNGMRQMIMSLRQNPYALETAFISVIIFAGKAKTLVSMTDVVSFYPPQLPIGGGTSLGAGLEQLMTEMQTKVVKNDGVNKGDWKPIVFLFTDGVPTDSSEQTICKWEEKYRDKTNLIAISIGNNADLNLLRRLTDQVLLFNDTRPESYKNFFQWITASISTQSQRVEDLRNDDFQLGNLDNKIIHRFDLEKEMPPRPDDNVVVLKALCQKNEATYFIKFSRNPGFDEWDDIITEGSSAHTSKPFGLSGAYALNSMEDYNELTVDNAPANTVNANDLQGNPSCPCCGNPFAFSICSCGGIMCIKGEGMNFCPHCKRNISFGFSSGGDDDDEQISRGLG